MSNNLKNKLKFAAIQEGFSAQSLIINISLYHLFAFKDRTSYNEHTDYDAIFFLSIKQLVFLQFLDDTLSR